MIWDYPKYTDEQHETWYLLQKRQRAQLPGRCAEEFLQGLDDIRFSENKIPSHHDIDKRLRETTGWGVVSVSGLVPVDDFFQMLSQKKFPCTNYIRSRENIDYTPEPDIFHDGFGHMPLLTNKAYTDFFHDYGNAGVRASVNLKNQLQRVYWFTIEFGLMRNSLNEVRAYGAGLMSSPGELLNSLSNNVRPHPFSFENVIERDFDTMRMQEDLFIISSFEKLREDFQDFCKKHKI